MVVLLLSVILIMGSAMIYMNNTSGKMHKAQRENKKAYYLCDATREELSLLIQQFFMENVSVSRSYLNTNLKDKTYTILKSNAPTTPILGRYLHTLNRDEDKVILDFMLENEQYYYNILSEMDLKMQITYQTYEQEYTITLTSRVTRKGSGGYQYELVEWKGEREK